MEYVACNFSGDVQKNVTLVRVVHHKEIPSNKFAL